MKKKLTLTVDESVIEMAKAYAEAHQQSVSAIFEKVMAEMAAPFRKKIEREKTAGLPEEEIHPDVKRLAGIFKTDEKDYDSKKVLEEELLKKYGS